MAQTFYGIVVYGAVRNFERQILQRIFIHSEAVVLR